MSIKPLIPPVEALVQEELDRASEKFGERHHSPHEAYAVMLEELQELEDEIAEAKTYMDAFWNGVKINNLHTTNFIHNAGQRAINAACEAIQLAAMCEKALRGYETEDKQ